MSTYGFGRILSADSRDSDYPMESLVPDQPAGRMNRFWWSSGYWGDQGVMPWAVDYAWHHWVCDGPGTVTHSPAWTPGALYSAARDLESNWEDGVSIRSAVKVLKSWRLVETYHWTQSVESVIRAIITRGPIVVGTNWYSSMTYPNAAGLVRVDGQVTGNHAYLLNGVSRRSQLIRIKNSWGRNWGRRGFALISFDDMARLLHEDGEACLAIPPTS